MPGVQRKARRIRHELHELLEFDLNCLSKIVQFAAKGKNRFAAGLCYGRSMGILIPCVRAQAMA
ncbi:MAG: hypothetical protein QM346_00210, partial [Chloroflexota bacterium]|nr:hypothetical protein [Chloroflexota bacterium]